VKSNGWWLGPLILCALLAGCGASSAKMNTTQGGTPTATAPQPTATASADASQLAACGMNGMAGVGRLGDLLVAPALAHLAYPAYKLPDGTPLKPLRLDAGSPIDTGRPPDPPTNPFMDAGGGGYVLIVCNSSSNSTHVVKSVSVRIDSVIPYSGQLNTFNLCDGIYNVATKTAEAGCGGGFCANETMKATFAAGVGAGAVVQTAQVGSDKDIPGGCDNGAIVGPFPVSLKPHGVFSINIGVATPSTPATFTFAFGLTQDAADAVFLPAARPVLLAPVAHKWTGNACLTPAMQAQIPAAGSPTYYICPAS